MEYAEREARTEKERLPSSYRSLEISHVEIQAEMECGQGTHQEEVARLQAELTDVGQQRAEAQHEAAMMKTEKEEVLSNYQRIVEEAVKKAVCDYRLFADYFRRKDEYASCYSKFGFYHGRNFLEATRPHESFEDMVFNIAMTTVPPQDWRKYEPNDLGPDESVRRALEDDLSNLLGPWSPFVSDLEEGEAHACSAAVDAIPTLADTIHFIEQGLDKDTTSQIPPCWFPREGSRGVDDPPHQD
ncbi:uncharacterized protein LOC127812304 isoform X1 [Diospyros lotus]|uniref:uncharacterized protein LOC127812304 isoform X1 n=1 Tax=Diospyros lotus TaxID=55363 RepID=UPI00225900F5|nr:uncharacterized protein LOC127812304 isoform X1 [Diospyros lotus]